MKKTETAFLVMSLVCLFRPSKALAELKETDSNNKFGIHLGGSTKKELEDAANLVNSTGGDWGYVTLVMEEKDRRQKKWQEIFDQMRQLHLIPIVRLATSPESSSWQRPKADQAEEWADFLDSLNWVVKDRHLVLFNEPNQGLEWGGRVDPQSYAQTALEFAQTLKEKNPDFFLILAGLDAAAPHQPPLYEDEEVFLRQMFASLGSKTQNLFQYLDGWASHSYPNHGFVGLPTDQGKHSVKTYLWELELLKNLGIEKDLPVFITETGWPHAEGLTQKNHYYPALTVGQNLKFYLNQLKNDSRVRAVTPFVLNYPAEPFDHFSWRQPDEPKEFYPQYQLVQEIAKTKGAPEQEQKLRVTQKLPAKLLNDSVWQIPIRVKNEGQAIWTQKDGYRLQLSGEEVEQLKHSFSSFPQIKPFEEKTVWLSLETDEKTGPVQMSLAVSKNGQPLSNDIKWSPEIVSKSSLDGILLRLKSRLVDQAEDHPYQTRKLVLDTLSPSFLFWK